MSTAIQTRPGKRTTEGDIGAPPIPPAPPVPAQQRGTWTPAPDKPNLDIPVSACEIRPDARLGVCFDHSRHLGNPQVVTDAVARARTAMDAQDQADIAAAVASLDRSKLEAAQAKLTAAERQLAAKTAWFDEWSCRKRRLEAEGGDAEDIKDADTAAEHLDADLKELEELVPKLRDEVTGQQERLRREAQALGIKVVAGRVEALRNERRAILETIARSISAQLDKLLSLELQLRARQHMNLDSEGTALGSQAYDAARVS